MKFLYFDYLIKRAVKARLNGFNICPTFAQQTTDVGQMLDDRSVQAVSTPFNILENKGNVEATLNGNLNQFK